MKRFILPVALVATMLMLVSCGGSKNNEEEPSVVVCDVTGETANDNDSYSAATNNNGPTDWDEFLDEYEKYVNESIELYNKAKGNKTAASIKRLESLETSIISMTEKLNEPSGSLSASQLQRFNNINNKYLKVLQNIENPIDEFDDADDDDDDADDDDDWD